MEMNLCTIKQAEKSLKDGKVLMLIDNYQIKQSSYLMVSAQNINQISCEFLLKNSSAKIKLVIMDILCIDNLLSKKMISKSIKTKDNSTLKTKDFLNQIRSTFKKANEKIQIKDPILVPNDLSIVWKKLYGILKRPKPQEAAVTLAYTAQISPAVFIIKCNIKEEDTQDFLNKNKINAISISHIEKYFMINEVLVEPKASARIPIVNLGEFNMTVFQYADDPKEHLLFEKNLTKDSIPLIRIHSECLTGDIFGSMRCDCGDQLHMSLTQIAKEGGGLIYLRQEGRGIGLIKKLKAYRLQDNGLDTYDANKALGLPEDDRSYIVAYQILKYLQNMNIRLLTNNPQKSRELIQYGIKISEIIPLITSPNHENSFYLKTKQQKKGHQLDSQINKSKK
ncbi:MAG: GTP cyclohydrolase II [Legionellaceae bacterium]|nr:GTP cyclohydrolase II [Legionellaceae bacterium]